jgi:hypothetical protein
LEQGPDRFASFRQVKAVAGNGPPLHPDMPGEQA